MDRRVIDLLVAVLVILILALAAALLWRGQGPHIAARSKALVAEVQRRFASMGETVKGAAEPAVARPVDPLAMNQVPPPFDDAPLPELPEGATPARPITPIGQWADAERDYPLEARQNEWEGQLTVRWTVLSDGRVSNCRIAKSSGYPALDAGTCRLVMRSAAYEPARDARGVPIESHVQIGWRWELEDRRRPVLAALQVLRLAVWQSEHASGTETR